MQTNHCYTFTISNIVRSSKQDSAWKLFKTSTPIDLNVLYSDEDVDQIEVGDEVCIWPSRQPTEEEYAGNRTFKLIFGGMRANSDIPEKDFSRHFWFLRKGQGKPKFKVVQLDADGNSTIVDA
jgi:hypothetical protein